MDVPVDVGPDEARDAAVRELSDPAYAQARPGVLEKALDWVLDRLDELFGAGSGAGGVALLLLVVVIALAVVIRLFTGRVTRAARTGAVFGDATRSAKDHRAAAQEAFARGEFAEAVRERFRALVRELEQRGVLDERAGRTVDEVAADAGRELPAHARDLRVAAVLFDDIWYGGRTATEEAYRSIASLDDRVRG
ncbi:DUF4129 domain-containing protein [Lentzea tibetensis]|uniref:DUF4129 domain-containing protein n=1 Tax=Lentzea tibetensis TaxID=2591470 RepID=A0A563ET90_9PSEU|nr:DUF4129 domain-containing protein [Lentzea tibetensis]TWP50873.1 DUF4129 domain-containing protein [Lentzea tibetensis]